VRRNLLRSFLTILGIVIGVSAVITMVTLGNGATQAIQTQITSLGTNLLLVMPGQRIGAGRRRRRRGAAVHRGRRRGHRHADRRRGRRGAAGRASVTVVANGRNWATSVTGSTNAWFDTGNWKLASGRLFEPTNRLPARPSASSAKPCGARSSAAPWAAPAWASSCASSSSRAR
jgi:putative ABC transport system permease protein